MTTSAFNFLEIGRGLPQRWYEEAIKHDETESKDNLIPGLDDSFFDLKIIKENLFNDTYCTVNFLTKNKETSYKEKVADAILQGFNELNDKKLVKITKWLKADSKANKQMDLLLKIIAKAKISTLVLEIQNDDIEPKIINSLTRIYCIDPDFHYNKKLNKKTENKTNEILDKILQKKELRPCATDKGRKGITKLFELTCSNLTDCKKITDAGFKQKEATPPTPSTPLSLSKEDEDVNCTNLIDF